jgi:hypothetical protein
MKKITHNLTNVKVLQSMVFTFMFLFSLTINSQATVGDEFLVNPGINTATGEFSSTPSTGVDGGGNFPENLGGWGSGGGGAYASTSTINGPCHSTDRMFKLFKKGGPDGQFINQTVTLPPGNFNWSFWTKWAVLVNWESEGDATPKFLIKTDDDGDGTWENVQTIILTQPTDALTWVNQTGTYVNDVERQVRIQFYKYGGTQANPSNLDQLMFIDDVSMTYAASLSTVDVTVLDMTIYPNPSNGSYVTIQSPVNGVKYVEVFDITGKRLINTSLNTDTLDVSSISTGMYLVKVTIEGQSKTSKLMIR